jgi:hypothetical protein
MIFKNEGPIMGTELKATDFVTAGDSIVPIEGAILFELVQVWTITRKKHVIENKNYLLKKKMYDEAQILYFSANSISLK